MLALRIDALLDDPVYRDLRIYVHDRGVQPLRYHIARMLDRNPGTPYRIELALHNVHTELFRRYVDFRLAQCAAHAQAPPAQLP